MARDPPSSLMSSSELRDLSLHPASVRAGCITIIHPQLRDLVLPLERGRVLYPRGTSLEEQQWDPPADTEAYEIGPQEPIPSRRSTFARLGFVPNCLTASGGILACGGQHGELYMTALPATRTPGTFKDRFARPPVKPFTVNLTLPTRSINNSMIVLPGWPEEWQQRSKARSLGYVGNGRKDENADELSDLEEESDQDEDEDEDEEEMDLDDDLPVGSPASSVATYPNTVPFLHAPRIPHLSPPTTSIEIPTITSRRSTSFSSHIREREIPRERAPRASFSTSTIAQPGHPPIQYVTSRPQNDASTSRSASMSSFRPAAVPGSDSRSCDTSSMKRSSHRRKRRVADEPRLLISNNDQTVKMFSLRQAEKAPAQAENTYERSFFDSRLGYQQPAISAIRQTADNERQRVVLQQDAARIRRAAEREEIRTRHALARDRDAREQELLGRLMARVEVPPPRAAFGSSFGWDRIGVNEGIAANEAASRHEELQEFERIIGMRVGSSSGSRVEDNRTSPPIRQTPKAKGLERKLAKVGGTRFKDPVNHSSLSPDLRTMVSVGDSTDVCLFEVIEGGQEFRKIRVYNAATDSGFSTAWSKDGRKFAVASQDGQVTVWDHRSSNPMAIFHTSTADVRQRSPSFADDLADSQLFGHYASGNQPHLGGARSPPGSHPLLVDPITGDTRTGTSSSGKEAARVVKFSPEGSPRDLLVFSEENSHIHIIDARTFDTHVIVPVPHNVPGEPAMPQHHRQGIDGGTVGIAGVAFDPTGDWLYSGTERTIVEWDMRRIGGGEGGTWGVV